MFSILVIETIKYSNDIHTSDGKVCNPNDVTVYFDYPFPSVHVEFFVLYVINYITHYQLVEVETFYANWLM